MFGLSGHHGSGAVVACSVALCAAIRSDRASDTIPPRCAPRPRCSFPHHFCDESLDISGNAGRP
jgi:hypothetical protein